MLLKCNHNIDTIHLRHNACKNDLDEISNLLGVHVNKLMECLEFIKLGNPGHNIGACGHH